MNKWLSSNECMSEFQGTAPDVSVAKIVLFVWKENYLLRHKWIEDLEYKYAFNP